MNEFGKMVQMPSFNDLTGKRFGRLTVLKMASRDKKGRIRWLCICECGNFRCVYPNHLKSGATQSCGCLSREFRTLRGHNSKIGERTRKHGDFGTKLYGVWAGMKRRCQNPNTKHYKDYGGRGIEVCKEWQKYEVFKRWALATGYNEGLSIERMDVDGDYCPSNCKWIPLKEQPNNTRRTVRLEYQGELYTLKEIAEMTGLKRRTIKGRYERGWSVEEIIKTGIKKNQYD